MTEGTFRDHIITLEGYRRRLARGGATQHEMHQAFAEAFTSLLALFEFLEREWPTPERIREAVFAAKPDIPGVEREAREAREASASGVLLSGGVGGSKTYPPSREARECREAVSRVRA